MLSNKNSSEKLQKLQNEEISVVENLNYFLKNINSKNKKLNIILNLYDDEAKKKAKKLDELSKKEKQKKTLFGLIVLIKSNISKINFNINCSSKVLENYNGSFDSDVVKFLENSGCVILGNLNCDEFACGSLGKNSSYNICKNPNFENIYPGGSSSGSASCISADFCDFSLGSDTGGSIRTPAQNCFVYGIKPSYNLISRYGLIDMAMSFDCIGPLTNDIKLFPKIMEVLCCKTNYDSTQNQNFEIDFSKKIEKPKIGFIKNFIDLLDDEIKKIYFEKIEELKKKYEIKEFEINNIDKAISSYYSIVYNEIYSTTRKYDGLKYGEKIEEKCGEEILKRINGGFEISKSEFDGEFYKKALSFRKILQENFSEIFSKCDFLIIPTTPILPIKIGEKIDTSAEYKIDVFTVLANLSKICGGVVPIKIIEKNKDKFPLGFQVLADQFCDNKMLQGMEILKNI